MANEQQPDQDQLGVLQTELESLRTALEANLERLDTIHCQVAAALGQTVPVVEIPPGFTAANGGITSSATFSPTPFRRLMLELCRPRGDEPEWPWVLCQLLEGEFLRQQQVDSEYTGRQVFIDRDNHDIANATSPERRAVYTLYHLCREQASRCLRVGDETYWLLGYEWPNQGNRRMSRADLVGLKRDGGLVVFECKLQNNRYAPVAAILEGLDYLACLTREQNFDRLHEGFWAWRDQEGFQIPDGFLDSEPDRAAKHAVILLAPQGYYDLYTRSQRGLGWQSLARVGRCSCDKLELGFAVSDFQSTTGSWAGCD